MVYVDLLILAGFESRERAQRLVDYLHLATRPDSPDGVPESESAWVPAFEFLPEPDEILHPDEQRVTVYFGAEAGAEAHQVCAAIKLLEPACMLTWENIEGDVIYQRWEGGENELIYAPDGLEDPKDDEKYNRKLDNAIKEQIDRVEGEPEKALLLIAKELCD